MGGIAIGQNSGNLNQGVAAVAIGVGAGAASVGGTGQQADKAIAIGQLAGSAGQGEGSIAIGDSAGGEQGTGSIAIGVGPGQLQGNNAVAIGFDAGQTNQSDNAVAIGFDAGQLSQSTNAVAIGNSAGNNDQGSGGVAIGQNAGNSNQEESAIAVGISAGRLNQGTRSVAIGRFSGDDTQGIHAVAVGDSSGRNTQATGAVALGYQAGFTRQGIDAIAIGRNAADQNQGDSAISIGAFTHNGANQSARSIYINATGFPQSNTTVTDSFFVKPIRNITKPNQLCYDNSTGEITWIAKTVSPVVSSGTFTPTVTFTAGFGAGTTPQPTSLGRFQQIGNVVSVNFFNSFLALKIAPAISEVAVVTLPPILPGVGNSRVAGGFTLWDSDLSGNIAGPHHNVDSGTLNAGGTAVSISLFGRGIPVTGFGGSFYLEGSYTYIIP